LFNDTLNETLPNQLAAAERVLLAAGGRDDAREGVTAFAEKRTAQFKGR
jgi:enoyl-CoA hydratase/carnithine racemase